MVKNLPKSLQTSHFKRYIDDVFVLFDTLEQVLPFLII